jgi:hypothetical protein
MSPAYPRPHNHSPPQPFFLTDVDQWFNIRLPASLSSINYRHQIGIHYFLRRNPQPAGTEAGHLYVGQENQTRIKT